MENRRCWGKENEIWDKSRKLNYSRFTQGAFLGCFLAQKSPLLHLDYYVSLLPVLRWCTILGQLGAKNHRSQLSSCQAKPPGRNTADTIGPKKRFQNKQSFHWLMKLPATPGASSDPICPCTQECLFAPSRPKYRSHQLTKVWLEVLLTNEKTVYFETVFLDQSCWLYFYPGVGSVWLLRFFAPSCPKIVLITNAKPGED